MMQTANKDKNLLVFILLALTIVAFLFFLGNQKFEKAEKERVLKFLELQNNFQKAPVLARAFVVYDATDHQEIYSKNGDEILPLASLAKTMSIIIALKENPDSNKVITISKKALEQDGNYGFSVGEKFNILDLIKLTLIGSVNDGAYALAESTTNYLDKMNERARNFGMQNTIFKNPTGLDLENPPAKAKPEDGRAGALGSARDANSLAIYADLLYPSIFRTTILPEIKIKSDLGKIYTIKNTDTIIGSIPNLVFSKTGYTDTAGGNLSIIFLNNAGHKIAITLLGSTKEGRFTDMEKLVNLSYNIGTD